MAVDTVQYIASWLGQHDLSDQAIAGILGNMQIESGFRTQALNSGEQAIGLVQWEGGRRQALQRYAASRGKSEGDLNTQLEFMWQELNGPYKAALDAIKAAPDAGAAAAAFDTSYEVSSGSSHGQRIAAAQSYAANGFHGGGTVDQATQNGQQQSVQQSASGAGGASGNTGPADPSTYEGQYTFVNDLANTVPEIKQIMAEASQAGWTAQRFADALQATQWWRKNSDSARKYIAMAQQDPATYAENIRNAESHASQIASSLGIRLNAAQLKQFATASLFQGLDDATLQQQIAATYQGQNGGVGGKSVNLDSEIKAQAQAYGVPVTQGWVNKWVQSALVNGNGSEGAIAQLKTMAMSTYPALKDQILAGHTVADIAQPYIASMANTLELPDTELKVTDPTIQKALHGTLTATPPAPAPATPGKAAPPPPPPAQSTDLYTFNQALKNDPRWQNTQNAKADAYSMLHGLGQSFGFAS